MSVHGPDSKLIEEKLEQVGDLKASWEAAKAISATAYDRYSSALKSAGEVAWADELKEAS